ncbi:MAG: DHH family phosphoesterase [Candidatus Micrarchaeia archaeon]
MDKTVFEKRTDMAVLLDKKKIILVTHLKDVDGIGSAAMALGAFNPERIIFSDYGKEPALELSQDFLEVPENRVVMFVDIGLSEDASDVYNDLFGKLKNNGNKIIWLDHHPVQDKATHVLENLADFAIAGEQKVCGAELLYEEVIKPLGFSSAKMETIKEMAHISDFNISGTPFDEKLGKATEAIASYLDDRTGMQEGLLKISKAIENDPINFDNDRFVSERAEIYELVQKQLKDELASNTYVVGNENFKAIIGFNTAGSLQSSDGCYFLLGLEKAKDENASIAIYVKAKLGTCHMRVNDESIDTLPLARALNGNGHPAASAFPVPEDFTISSREDMERFAKFLGKRIKEAYRTEDKAKSIRA